jgi:dipeptidyl-peptidase-4
MSRRPLFLVALPLFLACRAPEPVRRADGPELPGLLERLDQIFGRKELQPRAFGPVRWIESGAAYTTVEESATRAGGWDIVRHEAASGATSVLVPSEHLPRGEGGARPQADPLEIADHSWSVDGARLLFFTNTRRVWRQETRGDYWVLERASGKLTRLGQAFPEASLMFAKFSPQGTRVAYVQENDLWVEDLESGALVRLTYDGSAAVVNGTADWVYEEELDVRDGFRWSPDGTRIAFWRFDTSGVGTMTLLDEIGGLYPVPTTFAYPKAGTTNPAVRIGVVPAAGGAALFLDFPGDPREHYLARLEWIPGAEELLVQRLNRLQNELVVWIGSAVTGEVRELLRESCSTWLDVVDDWRWLPGERELLWSSERSGWRALWAVPRDGSAWRPLTPGGFDVTGVAGIDGGRGLVYFLAARERVTERALWCVPLAGGEPERVTPADQPGNHAYELAPTGELALHTHSRVDRPARSELVRLPGHEPVRVLESNDELARTLAPLLAAPTEFLELELEPGVELDAWLVRPRGFDPSLRYPLVLYVYGEPSSSQMIDGWKGPRQIFHRALAEAGYAVACIDPRGTPAPRGRAARKEGIYRHMGARAAGDIAAGLSALLRGNRWIDPGRVASWGWSGGGTMTLHLLFRYPELFAAGLSVAPVPDARLYDSIYQERFLGLPEENPAGYDGASPIRYAEGLEDPLLLVHGSGDDNVHFQGTQRLMNRLIELGKPFEFMLYPNRTHAIAEGPGTSLHVHATLARFLLEHVPPGPR